MGNYFTATEEWLNWRYKEDKDPYSIAYSKRREAIVRGYAEMIGNGLFDSANGILHLEVSLCYENHCEFIRIRSNTYFLDKKVNINISSNRAMLIDINRQFDLQEVYKIADNYWERREQYESN